MIKFFRQLRSDLIGKNKTGRYLKYAIGEIVLVVIGILIALSINNWNEKRKAKKFEHKLLEDINNSMGNNFFQLDLCFASNDKSIESVDIILAYLDSDLPYHDSLDYHFSKSIEWCSPVFENSGYETLKTYGRNLISNDTIRDALGIYDAGWMETLGQRQEDYFFQTVSPALIGMFDKVAMRTEMKPFDYKALKSSKTYRSILKSSKAYREDQKYWYLEWQGNLRYTSNMINKELGKE